MTLQEMIARQRQITEAARNESRSLTAEEQREFDQLQGQIDGALAGGSGADGSGGNGTGGEGTGGNPNRGADSVGGSVPAGAAAPGANPAAPDAEQRAALAERTRIREIVGLCQRFGIDSAEYISRGDSIDQVRAAVLDRLERNGTPISARVVADEADKKRAAIADGILLRNNIHVENPAPGSNDFRGSSLQMIAASCLANEDGANARNYFMMSRNDLFSEVMRRSYYNPTAAFPAIMDQVINKAYVEGHRTAPVTFDQFTTRGTLSDFKKADNYYVQGGFGEFLEVPEGGELKHTLPTDEKLPQRQLKTYGRQFTMSRQAFINDDMGVITTLPARAAKAARTTINTQVYRVLTGNPKIYDGKQLFGADHKNLLAEGTGITQAAVQSMILALGGHRKKMDGAEQAILIRPAVMVVPLGYKFAMYTLFNSQTISASGDVNPLYQYRDTIRVVEDATLNAQVPTGAIPWFMVGDTNDTDFIQVDYLNGQEIPNIRRMETPGQLGYVWDVYGDWGITVLDFRGAVKNPGVEIESPIATV